MGEQESGGTGPARAMRFGVALRPESISGLVPQVEAAERLGYGLIGITESVALARDPWMALVVTAQRTRRIRIGTLVTNPLVRHPMSLAAAAATLEEMAPGRTFVGIATGFSGVLNLQMRPATWAYLKEYIAAVRGLLEEGQARFQGQHLTVRWTPRKVPVYIAAHGPRAIREAARLADGVILGMGISAPVVQACLRLLDENAREVGRSMRDLDIWWYCHWRVGPDSGQARRDALWLAGSSARHLTYPSSEGKLVPEELQGPLRVLADAYDVMHHGAADPSLRDQFARRATELGVLDYLVERHAIAGTPAACQDRLQELDSLGARQLLTVVRGPDYVANMEQWHHVAMQASASGNAYS